MTPTDSSAHLAPVWTDAVDGVAGSRLRLHEGIRQVVQAFTRTASSAFNLPAGLTVACRQAPGALGVGTATAWVHDRRSHELVLTATSDARGVAEGARVSVTGAGMPAAALRAERPVLVADASGGGDGKEACLAATVAIPLRGRRRALGVLMIEAARWLSARRLLAVWRGPTWIQMISAPDFLRATEAAIVRPQVHGVYHLGDEQPVTLQRFLDVACEQWGSPRPYRLPLWTIMTAASLCELAALVARTPSPLTRDFISIGRVSYWGDTRRMREELLPTLLNPTLESGRSTL